MIKESFDNLVNWWKNEKISGTIMPIFLLLNIIKFQTSTNYTISELIANTSFIVVMIVAIKYYYLRSTEQSKQEREKEVRMKEIESLEKSTMKEVEGVIEVEMLEEKRLEAQFQQKKTIEDFTMEIVRGQKERQFALVVEEADYIDKAIMDKANHIIYLAKNFTIDEKIEYLIGKHETEIAELRVEKAKLPEKVERHFKSLMNMSEIPKVGRAGEIIESELTAVLNEIDNNKDVKSTMEEISA